MSEVRKHMIFHGRVQGVGFRYTAKYLARSMNLTGWVKNEYDGTVVMEVQGRETLIFELMKGLNRNQFIQIDWIDTEEMEPELESSFVNAANAVDTGLITFAARDSEFGGHKMKEGDILGLENGKLEIIDKDPVHAATRLARSMSKKGTSFITIIYGDNVSEAEAEDAFQRIKSKVGNEIEVTLVNGGQPIYYFILSIE